MSRSSRQSGGVTAYFTGGGERNPPGVAGSVLGLDLDLYRGCKRTTALRCVFPGLQFQHSKQHV